MANNNSIVLRITIYLIKKIPINFLSIENIFLSAKYLAFLDIFLKNLRKLLFRDSKRKKHVIKLQKNK